MRVLRTAAVLVLGLLAVRPGWSAEPVRPRLVVLVVIDQFPADLLERSRPGLSPRGMFQRMAASGANYTECHHRHAFTETAVAHATFLTGAYPCRTGITGNSMFDRVTGAWHGSVSDPDSPLVGRPASPAPPGVRPRPPAGVSPARLKVPTVGGMLKLSTAGKAKVFTVSIKDRAAVLMAGHAADAAFWFDARTGCWITSEFYAARLPDYLAEYNDRKAPAAWAGRRWTLLDDPEQYTAPTTAPMRASGPCRPAFPTPCPTPRTAPTARP